MAQNYNINSGFGFNVQSGAQKAQSQKSEVDFVQKTVDLFDSMTNYVDKYENVFDGSVAKEINMYSRQMMIVGMNMKAEDKNHRKFDMNI